MNIYIPKMYKKSIFDIDYSNLKCKYLLFDLDNTILPEDEIKCNNKVKELFKKIQSLDIKPIIFSNSPGKRVKVVADQLNIDYMSFACKPLSFKFKKILKKYNINKDNIAIIGDQLLTDVKGGNKIGIKTILVDPISDYDPFFTKINRFKESIIKNKINFIKGSYYE